MMRLLLTLTWHFLLALRFATSTASAQQITAATSSYIPAQAAQDISSRPASTSSAAATTTTATSLPPVLGDADATITTTTAYRAAVQTWPVHSLFLPIVDPGNLAASIISVHPNHTAYALGCLPPSLRAENASSCPLTDSLTLTEGASTVVYTQLFSDDEISPLTPSAVRVSCDLFGPAAHASKAACTAHSAISGLGVEAATTTLASTQITYVDVTVTEGQAKLAAGTATPVNGVSPGAGDGGEEGPGSGNAAARTRGGMGGWEVLVVLPVGLGIGMSL